MKAVQILIDEHLLIEQVLECLERMVEHCVVEHKLEVSAARDAIAFFRGFTERCHCSKEESELLPAMSRAIVASSRQRLDCSLLQRREEGRMHVNRMESLIEPAANGDATAMKEFVKHAQAYIDLLLDYIAREEDCLFPMVAQTLPEAEKVRLDATL